MLDLTEQASAATGRGKRRGLRTVGDYAPDRLPEVPEAVHVQSRAVGEGFALSVAAIPAGRQAWSVAWAPERGFGTKGLSGSACAVYPTPVMVRAVRAPATAMIRLIFIAILPGVGRAARVARKKADRCAGNIDQLLHEAVDLPLLGHDLGGR